MLARSDIKALAPNMSDLGFNSHHLAFFWHVTNGSPDQIPPSKRHPHYNLNVSCIQLFSLLVGFILAGSVVVV